MDAKKIIYLPVGEIIPYINNPRNNEEAITKVAASIKEFGFQNPIILDTKNIIITGHTRLQAAKRLGIDKVPCLIAEGLTDAQVKAYRIADNKVGEIAEWDNEKLRVEFEALQNMHFDLELSGFDFDEIADIMAEADEELTVTEDDYDGEVPEIPRTQPGDIYHLGKHILLCGDSTKAADMATLMQGELADLIVTDPPYNVNYESDNGKTIQNDNMGDSAFRRFLIDSFKAMDGVLRPGGAFYIWHADSEGLNFRGACSDMGWKIRQCLIWNKNSINMGHSDYQWKHEPCLYGWKEGAAHYFTDERIHATVIEDKGIDLNTMKRADMLALLREIYSDKTSTTIINEPKPMKSKEHPTMKPLKLLERLIRNSSKPGQIVMDTFGGSGSTLMTCEQLDRSCRMMELDPKYADVIVDRYIQATGDTEGVFLIRKGKKIPYENIR